MRRMTKREIEDNAGLRYRGAISTFGLRNGQKISLAVSRMFKVETNRRKELSKKEKKK